MEERDMSEAAGGTLPEVPRESMTRQAIWLSAAKVVGLMLNIVFPLLLVRIFDQAQFGLYRQCFLVVVTAQNILPLGMGISISYFLPREPERGREIVCNILLFHLLVGGAAGLLLWLYPMALVHLFKEPEFLSYAPKVGLVICLTVFASFLDVAPTALREVRLSSAFIILGQLTRSGFMLGAVLWSPSIHVLLNAAILQAAVQCAVLLYYLETRFPGFWHSFNWPFFRDQISYATPLGVATISLSLFEDLHHYFVSHSYDAATYAIYAVGCLQIPFLGAIRDAIGQLMILRVSQLQKASAHGDIMELTFRVARKLALMYLAVYAFFIVFGRDLLIVLYTRKYEASWPIFALYLTQVLLSIVMYDPIFRAYSSQRYFVLTVRAVLLAILIPALWIGLRMWGLMGAVGAVISVHFVERCLCYYRVTKILNIRRADWKGLADIPKIAAVAALAALCAATIRALIHFPHPILMLAVCGTVFAGVYAVGVWIWALIEVEEKEFILRLLRLGARSPEPLR